MKQAIIALVVLAVLGIGGFALFGRNTGTTNNVSDTPGVSVTPTRSGTSSSEQDDADTAAPSASPTTAEQSGGSGSADSQSANLSYSASGFGQSTVTVKSGSSITITNNSDQTIKPSSDPHPQHTDNDELNFGDILPGKSKTMTVSKTGTWGMHDHYDESHMIKVIVQ